MIRETGHDSRSTPAQEDVTPPDGWPVPVLLAGEEEWGDEPHIHRGID